jgi:tetratricopeptide (TPR) repeat protein
MRTLEPYHPNIAKSHNNIAIVHERKGDFARALESYEKALVIWKKVYGEDHFHIAVCLSNIGLVHMHEKKYTKALECHEKALIILT